MSDDAKPATKPATGAKPGGKPGAKGGPRPKSARRRSREIALQGLYEWLIGGSDAGVIDAHMREQEDFDKADRVHYDALLHGCITCIPEKAHNVSFSTLKSYEKLQLKIHSVDSILACKNESFLVSRAVPPTTSFFSVCRF